MSLYRRPSALAIAILAILGVAAGLAAAVRPTTAPVRWQALEVSARRAPAFELIPTPRRDEAVLRAQPDIQLLGAGATLARAKLARLQAGRGGRLSALAARSGRRGGADRPSGRPSGAATARLRAPPSPA